MKISKDIFIQVGLLGIQVLFSISVFGGLTGWFHNQMDLLKFIVFVAHVVCVAALVLPVHIVWFVARLKKKSSKVPVKLCGFMTIICIGITAVLNISIYGGMYPPLEGEVRKSYRHEFMDAEGKQYEYWVELVNPFHSSHKERLVLISEGERKVFDLKLKEKPGTFLTGPKDILVEKKGDQLFLESHLNPRTRYVLLDYQTGTVISNWLKSTVEP